MLFLYLVGEAVLFLKYLFAYILCLGIASGIYLKIGHLLISQESHDIILLDKLEFDKGV